MNRITRLATLLAVISVPAMAAMPSWDYRIKLSKNTGGLKITAHTFVGPAVTVGLENHSGKTALCKASFVGYPHPPSGDEILSTRIAPGKRATLAYPYDKLGGHVSTVFVDLKCAAT